MKVDRGASQILFSLLPEQTADFERRVWKVSKWVDPVPIAIDDSAVREALRVAIAPWVQQGTDQGFADDLRRGMRVDVIGLNTDRGVLVETFPKLWRCKDCREVHGERTRSCRCGSQLIAQLHYVAYHSCGAIAEPLLPKCQTHRRVRINLPGSASAAEIAFECPVCNRPLGKGLMRRACGCGQGQMNVTVHRAASVYTPRYAVLVNPPDPAVAARLRTGGGPANALRWVIDGMVEDDPTGGGQTYDGVLQTLLAQGLSRSLATKLAQDAVRAGEVSEGLPGGPVALPESIRERAQSDALSLAAAVMGGRMRVDDLAANAGPALKPLYESEYAKQLAAARLEAVELLSGFPVATLAFGYTRGDVRPGATRLVAFKHQNALQVFGQLAQTEALFFRLDPLAVVLWLKRQGFLAEEDPKTRRDARLALLRTAQVPSPWDEQGQGLGTRVLGLVHSYAHRAVRQIAAFAGIERDSIAEYLVPSHLGFVIYAAARGDFILGGMQAVFETSLHSFLHALQHAESRCPLDPACRAGGGACMACLHLGEPSCRWFNRFLSRAWLFGPHGYLRT